ncbi:MAG: DUF6132 family protein [Ginsengibacter sp.]
MRSLLKKNLLTIIGVTLGAVGGYFYYHFVGCDSGTCAITSRPVNSTLYGALMGGLLFNIFKKKETSISKKKGLTDLNNISK